MATPIHTTSTLREFEGEGYGTPKGMAPGGSWLDDGYEFIAVGERNGWRPVASWGRDGWDLGQWPYVVYLFREREVTEDRGRLVTSAGATIAEHRRVSFVYERASYCEGDITVETYATEEDRRAATDETAWFYWRSNDEEWIRGVEPGQEPDHLKGPYSRKRAVEGET